MLSWGDGWLPFEDHIGPTLDDEVQGWRDRYVQHNRDTLLLSSSFLSPPLFFLWTRRFFVLVVLLVS